MNNNMSAPEEGPQVLDSPAVNQEEDENGEEETFRLYKKRWLILFAIFSIHLALSLHRCIMSIQDRSNAYIARAIDHFGIRRMAYFACAMLVLANTFKTLCLADEKHLYVWISHHRYHMLLVSEFFFGLGMCVCLAVPPKVAKAWFPVSDNTLACFLAYLGFNTGASISNFLTPILIQTPDDMYKLCYMYIVATVFVILITFGCITRSAPKRPPSANAATAANSTKLPLTTSLSLMLTSPQYVLLVIGLTFNLTTMTVMQTNLQDILAEQKYSDVFCGQLIAVSFFSGIFFTLLGAYWLDSTNDIIKFSKITSALFMIAFLLFNVSISIQNMHRMIILTNLLLAFSCSLMYPAMFQVSIRAASGILPEASVSALINLTIQVFSIIEFNSLNPLRSISHSESYIVPLICLSSLLVIINLLYVVAFKLPRKEDLQRLVESDEENIEANN